MFAVSSTGSGLPVKPAVQLCIHALSLDPLVAAPDHHLQPSMCLFTPAPLIVVPLLHQVQLSARACLQVAGCQPH